jgi:hypothetical protein
MRKTVSETVRKRMGRDAKAGLIRNTVRVELRIRMLDEVRLGWGEHREP